MYTITIAALSVPGNISASSMELIRSAKKLFLQTAAHPSAQWILDEKLAHTSMDDLYASSEDFDELNSAIAKRLLCGTDAVYAVPGRGVGESQLAAIRSAALSSGVSLKILPGTSYALCAMAAAQICCDTAVLSSAMALPLMNVDPEKLLCIEELDTPLRAGELKLALGEYYPDESPVIFCTMDENGAYQLKEVQLYTLDRQPEKEYFASTVAILPPVTLLKRPRHGLDDLVEILRCLRAPGGCPWDAKQTHSSLRPSLLEECYEVLQTIDDDDIDGMCEELGDLLLQIVFHAQLEAEKRNFTMRDVSTGIVNKLIYRHPHVFADAHVNSSEEVLVNWEKLKKKEKHFESQSDMIDAIPRALPALIRSAKVQKKAADVGFDWDAPEDALKKVYEEVGEVREAIAENCEEHIEEELGDLLFACVNVTRMLHKNAELLLQASSDKFAARFRALEDAVREDGQALENMDLAQMDAYWERIKKKF